jgi:hypothetical protein
MDDYAIQLPTQKRGAPGIGAPANGTWGKIMILAFRDL